MIFTSFISILTFQFESWFKTIISSAVFFVKGFVYFLSNYLCVSKYKQVVSILLKTGVIYVDKYEFFWYNIKTVRCFFSKIMYKTIADFEFKKQSVGRKSMINEWYKFNRVYMSTSLWEKYDIDNAPFESLKQSATRRITKKRDKELFIEIEHRHDHIPNETELLIIEARRKQ